MRLHISIQGHDGKWISREIPGAMSVAKAIEIANNLADMGFYVKIELI